MAGTAIYTAILDANVMYPVTVSDILIQFAVDGIFNAKWTIDIDNEWTRNLIVDRKDLTEASILSRRDFQREVVLDWAIAKCKYEGLIPSLSLPDPNDRHVLDAAIVGQCDCIVTFNISDFPHSTVVKYDIEVIHPDDFICIQLDLFPYQALNGIKNIRSRLRKPPKTANELLLAYEKAGLLSTVNKLKDAIKLI